MKTKTTIVAILTIVSGIVLIIVGNIFAANLYTFNSHIDLEKYSFGGDFYTEIYNAVRRILYKLNSFELNFSIFANWLSGIYHILFTFAGIGFILHGIKIFPVDEHKNFQKKELPINKYIDREDD